MRNFDFDDRFHKNQAGPLLSVAEVASRLQCSKANVYSLIGRGVLPVIRIGRKKGYRVDPRDLERFMDQRKTQSQLADPAPPRPRLRHLRL